MSRPGGGRARGARAPGPLGPVVTAGMAKDPRDRPADASSFVTELTAVAAGAYGRGWQERGRSHLGEAALLRAALWPSGAARALQGWGVERIDLSSQGSVTAGESRHLWHLRHIEHLRHVKHLRAVAAGAIVFALLAAGTALAAASAHQPGPPGHPDAAVHLVTLQPPPSSVSPALSGSPKLQKAKKASPPPGFLAPPTSASPQPKPTKSTHPSPSPSPKPSPSPSPSPSPTPTFHPPSRPPSSSPPPGR